ncbi:MAG: hypothetical protein HQ513_08740 [Rhodospirillales bacterium]|nr:hypothetical protein [Rhodospirillales bacterium]
MADKPLSGENMQGPSRPESNDFQDRTFMGGIGLATRSSLLVMLGFAVMVGGGFALNFADKELAKADVNLSQATSLNTFAASIERDVWRIRAEQRELSNRASDAANAAAQEHLALVDALGQRIDGLYQRPDAALIGEHVSTLREAVALYGEQYQKSMQKEASPGPDMTGLEANLRRAIRDIGKILTSVNSLSINETMMSIRAATTAFVESGSGQDLVIIEGQQKEFSRLLTSIPITLETKNALRLGLENYNASLTAFAKVRLVANNSRNRLSEITSYMVPSIDAINSFAGDNFVEAQRARVFVRHRYRTLIAAGAAGAVMLVLLFGLAMVRSISGPVSAAAEAARNLTGGNTDIVVWGLGNEDETGDIARAFWALKESLAQANTLGLNMEKARAEAERGRAASTEAEWLRRDLQSMKAEADKGKEAVAEAALLRKIIDATTDTIGKNQNAEINEEEIASAPVPESSPEMSLDSISSISRQVAQSSQNVTAAADEAERTGTLIRNLSDATGKIGAIEGLIAAIGEQADMLVIGAMPQRPDTNLVMLNGEASSKDPMNSDAVARRFDAIRSAASQANWAVRDIGSLIKDSRDISLDIARLSSTEALEVTTELLQQSENLRGMLDKLVNRMQDQIIDTPDDQTNDGDLLS